MRVIPVPKYDMSAVCDDVYGVHVMCVLCDCDIFGVTMVCVTVMYHICGVNVICGI